MKDKAVLVLGLGISGCGAARFLLSKGNKVFAWDADPELMKKRDEAIYCCKMGMIYCQGLADIPWDEIGLVIVSPGIPPSDQALTECRKRGLEVIGEMELAARHLKNRAVGITGTNGKTTVTLLVSHVLNHVGMPALALGNVGQALCDRLNSLQDEILVLELSSYQLETLETACLDAGVILNISPDHLDRYGDLHSYAKAKFLMQRALRRESPLFLHEALVEPYKGFIASKECLTFGYNPSSFLFTDKNAVYIKKSLEDILPLEYRGKVSHEVENILAALALCHHLGVKPEAFFEAMKSFSKPPHRLEFVKMVDGVSYHNDSKGSNVDAVLRAVETLGEGIHLIVGGRDKEGSYEPWLGAFPRRVKALYGIGEAAPRIRHALEKACPFHSCNDLENALLAAKAAARAGEHVLLSPGCSSFDMFDNYAHRGDCFKNLVNNLE